MTRPDVDHDCAVAECRRMAVIRQRLHLRTMPEIQIPLCETHNKGWEDQVKQLHAEAAKARKADRDNALAFDLALTLAAFPAAGS